MIELKINQLKVGIHQIRGKIQHAVSATAASRQVGRRIQSLARIPRGLGHWIEGPWRKSFQRGNVTNMVATSLRNCTNMAAK